MSAIEFIIFQFVTLAVLIGLFGWLCLVFVSGIISNVRGAPYVPMKARLVRELLIFGELSSGDIFCDLGSGDGRVLLSAVHDFHVREAIGYETAPWPYSKSLWRVKQSGLKNISIHRDNLFQADLNRTTFIYAYLFPRAIERLALKLERELRPGVKILLPSFPIDTTKHPSFSLKKEAKIGSITAYLYEKSKPSW